MKLGPFRALEPSPEIRFLRPRFTQAISPQSHPSWVAGEGALTAQSRGDPDRRRLRVVRG